MDCKARYFILNYKYLRIRYKRILYGNLIQIAEKQIFIFLIQLFNKL